MAGLKVRFTVKLPLSIPVAMIAAFLSVLCVVEVGSENLTLTTYWPAPGGVYEQLVVQQNVYLSKNGRTAGARVGIGTTNILDDSLWGQKMGMQVESFACGGNAGGTAQACIGGDAAGDDLELLSKCSLCNAVVLWNDATGGYANLAAGEISVGSGHKIVIRGGVPAANTRVAVGSRTSGSPGTVMAPQNGCSLTTTGSCGVNQYLTSQSGFMGDTVAGMSYAGITMVCCDCGAAGCP